MALETQTTKRSYGTGLSRVVVPIFLSVVLTS